MIEQPNLEEEKRLKELEDYGILNTPDDPSFDSITKLASAICGTPIAAVTFIERDRQWFKSSVGLGGVKETHRKDSFCTFTIQDDSVLEVKDATLDSRFQNNILVTGNPNIRYYAGAPLITPTGKRLGALCVIGTEPHSLSDQQLEALKILSGQVVELMELRRSNRELALAKKFAEDQQNLMIDRAKLQTIGELAGGVCHQINNPLAIIVGRSMILRSQLKSVLPADSELFKELDIIDQTSQRVSGIIKALRVYSRDMGENRVDADISELIDDVLLLIQPRMKMNDIKLTYEKMPGLKIKMNKNQISQVIMNLLNNSVEALEESPTKEIIISVVDGVKNITFKIADTGKGIPVRDREKVFESFFSTKNRNFGIGLSNAQNFIYQHNGEISLLCAEGPTTFQFVLPKAT